MPSKSSRRRGSEINSSRHSRPPFSPSMTELAIRFADVDMMQVAHHSAYIHWFEQIRFSFLERIMGVQCEELTRAKIAFPVIECHANYLPPVPSRQPLSP